MNDPQTGAEPVVDPDRSSEPPVPPTDPPGAPPSSPPTLEDRLALLEQAQTEERRKWEEHRQELLVKNAVLEERIKHQQPSEPTFLGSAQEYELMGENLKLKAQADPENRERYERDYSLLDQNYRQFQQHDHQRKTEEQERRITRASFLATRQIDPQSENAKAIEYLHEQGLPLERVESLLLAPATELDQLKGQVTAHGAQTGVQVAATTIEPGRERIEPPAPLTTETKTPDQLASDDLVSRYQRSLPNFDERMFGEE